MKYQGKATTLDIRRRTSWPANQKLKRRTGIFENGSAEVKEQSRWKDWKAVKEGEKVQWRKVEWVGGVGNVDGWSVAEKKWSRGGQREDTKNEKPDPINDRPKRD